MQRISLIQSFQAQRGKKIYSSQGWERQRPDPNGLLSICQHLPCGGPLIREEDTMDVNLRNVHLGTVDREIGGWRKGTGRVVRELWSQSRQEATRRQG